MQLPLSVNPFSEVSLIQVSVLYPRKEVLQTLASLLVLISSGLFAPVINELLILRALIDKVLPPTLMPFHFLPVQAGVISQPVIINFPLPLTSMPLFSATKIVVFENVSTPPFSTL